MHRALDHIVEDEALGEVRLLVGAEAIGREESTVRRMIDGEGPLAIVEAEHVLRGDRVGPAGLDRTLGHDP